MASNTLFPPIIDNTQPSFLYKDKCRIYFTLSDFNILDNTSGLLITVVDQKTNKSVLNTGDYPAAQKYISKDNFKQYKTNNDKIYYIELDEIDFVPDKYYKSQIRLVANGQSPNGKVTIAWINSHLNYFSEWSEVTIYTPINYPYFNNIYLSGKTGSSLLPCYEEKTPATVVLSTSSLVLAFDVSFYNDKIDATSRLIAYDETDRVSSYEIIVYNETESEELYSSGPIYTDITNSCSIYKILPVTITNRFVGETTTVIDYRIKCRITTVQGYVSPFVDIVIFNKGAYNNFSETPKTKQDIDNGCIVLYDLPSKFNVTQTTEINVSILRADTLSEFKQWEEIYSYIAEKGDNNEFNYSFTDFTCQAGDFYEYKVIANSIEIAKEGDTGFTLMDYDDMFLYGGNGKQLCVKYNPQVSSFKIKVSDSSYDTLGSAYPIIVRNGNLYYREFSISGLISMQSDENELFLNHHNRVLDYGDASYRVYGDGKIYNDLKIEELAKYRDSTPSNRPISTTKGRKDVNSDFFQERRFRDEVIKFLNNGKPKLLKSPSEGNIIVRLKDVSFTPNQQLGRMIWTFSANATEIAEPTIENYKKFDLI